MKRLAELCKGNKQPAARFAHGFILHDIELKRCVQLCPVVSGSVRLCLVVSGCVRLCPVVSGCVRLCPIVSSCHSKGWCGGAAGGVPAAQPPQPGVAAAKPLVLCKMKLALHYKNLKKI